MAMGTGFLRTFGIIASGVVTVACYWIFIPSHGIQAAPWVTTLGMVVLTVIYGYAVLAIYRKQRQRA
jgi:purine-cytosine permease-like protein